MAAEISVVTGHMVSVKVSSTITSFVSERRFPKDLQVSALKGKLELLTGAQCGTMQVEVYNPDDKLICTLDNNEALLGSYAIDDECRIHVVDKSGTSIGQFEDLSNVQKYEMTQDDYDKRSDSVKAFKERMKLGRFNAELVEEKAKQEEEKAKREQEKMETISIGDRCEVQVPKNPTRRGTVRYKGTTEFAPGLWIGVQYDEPLGKNNGTVKGKQYFSCPDKYGGFIKPSQVTIGDFPEEFDMEEDEM